MNARAQAATKGAIRIQFSDALDRASSTDVSRYAVKVWGLTLYLTLVAGVFSTMARAFGWI